MMERCFKIDQILPESDGYRIRVSIDWSSEVFTGHFPDYPVFPGALMLDVIHTAAEMIFNENLKLFEAKGVKFLNAITPANGDSILLSIEQKGEGGKVIRVTATDRNEVESFRGELKYVGF